MLFFGCLEFPPSLHSLIAHRIRIWVILIHIESSEQFFSRRGKKRNNLSSKILVYYFWISNYEALFEAELGAPLNPNATCSRKNTEKDINVHLSLPSPSPHHQKSYKNWVNFIFHSKSKVSTSCHNTIYRNVRYYLLKRPSLENLLIKLNLV